MSSSQTYILPAVALVAIPLAIAGVVYLIVPAGRAVGWLVVHVCRFLYTEIADTLRLLGSVVMLLVLGVLTLLNVVIGRWSASSHYGRAVESELRNALMSGYRIILGNPARLLLLTPLVEGFENRLPKVVADAPGPDRPGKRIGQFDGYTIIGSLQGGGSGGRLYIAKPTPEKLAALARSGAGTVGEVVIKTFSLLDGSTLPQIVRENRALPAAKRLGLILEHEITEDRFFYVTRYVPGEPLDTITHRLHALSGIEGLSPSALASTLAYASDIVRTLRDYHSGGLWHKDVKPNNIIVNGNRAELVDFGLVTPLRSSLTLTTHGTEYFRDPEMVRMALRGAKVHEVDGAKFDIFGAGAVMYAMIENSFPAHGGLSQITKRCPEALRWIVRRAMTDYDKRYQTAAAMLEDIEALRSAADPMTVKPIMLPSVRAGGSAAMPQVIGLDAIGDDYGGAPSWNSADRIPGRVPGWQPGSPIAAAAIGSGGVGTAVGMPLFNQFAPSAPPHLRVTNWWSGKYQFTTGLHPGAASASTGSQARIRAEEARKQAQSRLRTYRREGASRVNAGIVLALLTTIIGGGLLAYAWFVPALIHNAVNGGAINALSEVANVGPSRSSNRSRRVIVGIPGDTPKPWDQATRDVQSSLSGLGEAIRRGVEQGVVESRRVASSNTSTSKTAVASPPVPTMPGRVVAPKSTPLVTPTIVVLRDPASFEPAHFQEIDSLVAALSNAGHPLLGNPLLAPPPDPVDRENQESLLAELRNVIGVSAFGSVAAGQAVRAYLDENAELRRPVLVWFGRAETGEVVPWVLGRTGVKPAVVESVVAILAHTGEPAAAKKVEPNKSPPANASRPRKPLPESVPPTIDDPSIE